MKHPWHSVSKGDKAPQILNAVIEVPKGSKVKYELSPFNTVLDKNIKYKDSVSIVLSLC